MSSLTAADAICINCEIKIFFKRGGVNSRISCASRAAGLRLAREIAVQINTAVYGNGKMGEPGFVAHPNGAVSWGNKA